MELSLPKFAAMPSEADGGFSEISEKNKSKYKNENN